MAYGGSIDSKGASLLEKLMLIEKTGWTLEYINTLDMDEYTEIVTIYDAVDSARNYLRSRNG